MIPGITASGRKPWTPYDLFEVGVEMAWYNPANLTSLWQDVAATIPVTTDGDVVARIDDSYGVGPWLQNGNADNRPVYRTDGNLHWLEFDGVDDYLNASAAGVNPIGAMTALTMALSFNRLADVSNTQAMSQYNPNNPDGYAIYGTTGNPSYVPLRQASQNYNLTATGAPFDTLPRVVTYRWNGNLAQRQLRHNDLTYLSGASPSGTIGPDYQGPFTWGKRSDINGQYLNGNSWGLLVMAKAVSDDEFTKLHEYMRRISGQI